MLKSNTWMDAYGESHNQKYYNSREFQFFTPISKSKGDVNLV